MEPGAGVRPESIGLQPAGRAVLPRSAEIPTNYRQLVEFAAVGGISEKRAEAIYDQVENAVIGGWPMAAQEAQVPGPMVALWGKEIANQTKPLRATASRF